MQASHTIEEQIQQELLYQLYRVTPIVSIMATVGAVVASFPFLSKGPNGPVALWLASFVLVSLARIGVTVWFLRRPMAERRSRAWFDWAAASTLAHAALWGLCSVAISGTGNALEESILHVVLAAVAMGAAVHLCGYFPLLLAYIVTVLGPLVVRDLAVGGSYHLILAFLSFMIGAYALLNGRNQSQAIVEILNQRRRNAELIEELQRENAAANEARQAAERANQAKARLFAAANHDLRQPLHAITLLVRTLRGQIEMAQAQATATRIADCVENLSQLTDAMLELSQLDSGMVTPQITHFTLQNLIDDVARTYEPIARAKGLRFEVPPAPQVVQGDQRLLMRVLSNLVANAVRYTSQGGVRLTVSEEPSQVTTRVRVAVVDTGPGIADEELPRIFEEFYQVGNRARDRRLGLGLGLATVRRLSDLMSLDVAVQSKLNQGSTFSIVLPLGRADCIATEREASGEGELAALRVLVVEDDADSRVALSALLRQWGCDVRATESGHAALDWVAEGYRPEVIVADYRLSEGLTGAEVITRLSSVLPEPLPALLITGDDPAALEGRGGLLLLRKPVKPLQLRAFLNKALAERC